MNDKLLNLPATAREIGVSIAWLKYQAESGNIPHIRVSARKYLFALEATRQAITELAACSGKKVNRIDPVDCRRRIPT